MILLLGPISVIINFTSEIHSIVEVSMHEREFGISMHGVCAVQGKIVRIGNESSLCYNKINMYS